MPQKQTARTMGASAPENYERYFVPAIGRPLAHDLVRVASLREGERVLDVGCGTGIVTRLAAEKVGPMGVIVGVDIDPGMLAVARSVTPTAAGIRWYEANAEEMPLPDQSFDVVLCQMSLQFVPDRVKALRDMHRVLVPGGRLILNLPGPPALLFKALAEAMGRHIRPEARGFVQRVFSLHEPSELERMMAEAGYRDIEVQTGNKHLSLPKPRDFLWQYVNGTPLAGAVSEADSSAQAALESEVVSAWKAFEDDGGMVFDQRMVFARAFR